MPCATDYASASKGEEEAIAHEVENRFELLYEDTRGSLKISGVSEMLREQWAFRRSINRYSSMITLVVGLLSQSSEKNCQLSTTCSVSRFPITTK